MAWTAMEDKVKVGFLVYEAFYPQSSSEMSDKLEMIIKQIKQIVENQDKERELLGQIILSIALKEEGPFTADDWELRKYELLKAAGLPTPVISWSVSQMIRRKRKQLKAEMEK